MTVLADTHAKTTSGPSRECGEPTPDGPCPGPVISEKCATCGVLHGQRYADEEDDRG